jgi:DNA replication licensing factor MCM5
MDMQSTASTHHVMEALRLFKVSTMQAATSSMGDSSGRPNFDSAVHKAEKFIDNRISIGLTVNTQQLLQEMVRKGYDEPACRKAFQNGVLHICTQIKLHKPLDLIL